MPKITIIATTVIDKILGTAGRLLYQTGAEGDINRYKREDSRRECLDSSQLLSSHLL